MPIYAQVIIPKPLDGTFTYLVPDEMASKARPGHRVLVPFGGKRYYTGLVESVSEHAPSGVALKPVAVALDDEPVVRHPQVKLWKWLADYYLCSVGEVFHAALPSGLRIESETVVELAADEIDESVAAELSDSDLQLLELIRSSGTTTSKDLAKASSRDDVEASVNHLIALNLIKVSERSLERFSRRRTSFVKPLFDISEADAVKAVIAANAGNIDRQTRAMRALPFYKTTLLEDYLPRLRKVEYRIVSSKYRPLTESEIAELYNKDYRTLSPYHFWKLYTESADTARREEIMRRALEIHPEFITAASDLTALTIDCERADDSILKPFAPDMADVAAVRKFPLEARYNLAVASMAGNHYSYADSLLYDMPDDARFHKAKMYCAALNGRYASVLQEIAEESPLNEVLMLLALHNNSRAYEKSRQLGESAEEEYVKAIAANRMADADAANGFLYLEASTHLANAIRKKPELLDTARIDGDVIDLLDEDGNLPDDELSDTE